MTTETVHLGVVITGTDDEQTATLVRMLDVMNMIEISGVLHAGGPLPLSATVEKIIFNSDAFRVDAIMHIARCMRLDPKAVQACLETFGGRMRQLFPAWSILIHYPDENNLATIFVPD